MELTNIELVYINQLFNKDGYVLDFNNETFGIFTTVSTGENIQMKYNLSKGRSLDRYFADKTITIEKKMTLLKDLLEHAEGVYTEKEMDSRRMLGKDYAEPVLNQTHLQRCKDILQKRNGKTVKTDANLVREIGLKELIKEAQDYINKDKKVAVEKIWDALERLKSNYVTKSIDKKASAERIVDDISNKHPIYKVLFNDEFLKLTEIGNKFRIRHHEVDKIEIIDLNYYDYFFNRCMTLIDLATRYL